VNQETDVLDKKIRVLENPEKQDIEYDPGYEKAFSHPIVTIPQDASSQYIIDADGSQEVRKRVQAATDEEKQGNSHEQIPGKHVVPPAEQIIPRRCGRQENKNI